MQEFKDIPKISDVDSPLAGLCFPIGTQYRIERLEIEGDWESDIGSRLVGCIENTKVYGIVTFRMPDGSEMQMRLPMGELAGARG